MRRGSILLVSICATMALAASPASAQALGDSLGYLRDNLAGQGQLAETETVSDSSTGKSWVEHWTMQYSNLRPDLAACSLTFRADFNRDGASIFSGDLTYALGQLAAVRLLTLNQNMDENNAHGGHPTWTTVADPPSLDIRLTFAAGNTGGFYIRDPSLAPRIAAAIARAAKLCGANPSREGF
jgi:hypothetical protein